MTLDDASTEVVARLRHRLHGAILGLALGEALAAPTQWAKPGRFTPVRDLIGGGPYDLPRGSWSDETAMMLASARSLVQVHASDIDDQREALRRWQRFGEHSAGGECLGITASVAAALNEGEPDRNQADGADALVRLVPWVIRRYAATPGEGDWTATLTAVVGITSHEPATLASAERFALMLHSALRGASREAIVEAGEWDVGRQAAGASAHPGSHRIDPSSAEANATTRVLSSAINAFAAADQWRTAVLDVVNLGGDSDVAGAVCGALAGAHFGVEALPSAWKETLAQRAILEETADALLADLLIELHGEDG